MNKSVLAVGAHPDDIEFSCTGTLIKLKKKGYNIYYIVATNGENGFKDTNVSRDKRIRIRKNEQLKAASILGVNKVFFLGYKDGFLKYTDSLHKKLVTIIRETKPSIIFSFDPSNRIFESINLNHRDHRIISEAVFDAVFAAKNKFMYKGTPHKPDYFYFFGTNKPDFYENISSQIEKKILILKQHDSQFSDFSKTKKWIKTYLSTFTKKYKYSEAFRKVQIKQIFA